jgi:hypothetical protein
MMKEGYREVSPNCWKKEQPKLPIRVGDQFRNSNGIIYEITEDLKFGQGYWWVTLPDRTRQGIFNRNVLETMTRV